MKLSQLKQAPGHLVQGLPSKPGKKDVDQYKEKLLEAGNQKIGEQCRHIKQSFNQRLIGKFNQATKDLSSDHGGLRMPILSEVKVAFLSKQEQKPKKIHVLN
jgi:hypothetical protein